VQVYASGRRKWIQCGSRKNPSTGKWKPYFWSLGNVDEVKLADARIKAGGVKADARDGQDTRKDELRAQKEQQRSTALAETTVEEALKYYVENRNCAPSSKYVLDRLLRKHLPDWMDKHLLSIDCPMLNKRYRKVLEDVKAKGDQADAKLNSLSDRERLLRAPRGYRTGLKTADDVVEGFGRIYNYWTRMHLAKLQKAGIVVPSCPTVSLLDELLPVPQRVKGVPLRDLGKLWRSFASYPGNPLHVLLARFLRATGLRVGVAMACKPAHIQPDRIVIPAATPRSKVRWNKRHLEHMAKIVPRTPEIDEILQELERVAPNHGDAKEWLFPSPTSKSGHMEEEKAACLALREHAGVRFTFHQLRHNLATAAEDLGYSKAQIKELLGQATDDVTDRYIDERVKRHREQLLAITAKLNKSLAAAAAGAPAAVVWIAA
jgi:integrase